MWDWAAARPPWSRSTTFLAIGMLQRLRRRDVDVPGAIRVVGYDDILGTDFCQPSLTIAQTDVEHAGRTLVDLVLGRTRPDTPIVIPSQLVVRESNGTGRLRRVALEQPRRSRALIDGRIENLVCQRYWMDDWR